MSDSENVPDVYVDQIQINTSPYGSTINFSLSAHTPPAPGTPATPERKVTVRMSLQHLKVMSYILQRQVRQHEESSGVRIGVATQAIASIGIAMEDWDTFWG